MATPALIYAAFRSLLEVASARAALQRSSGYMRLLKDQVVTCVSWVLRFKASLCGSVLPGFEDLRKSDKKWAPHIPGCFGAFLCRTLGLHNVLPQAAPEMAAEDFGFFSLRFPSCFWLLGTRNSTSERAALLHTPGVSSKSHFASL